MTLSFVLQDEFTALSERTLRDVAKGGATVPGLWEYEILNGLRAAEKRGRLSAVSVASAIRGLTALPIARDPAPLDRLRVTDTARTYDLSVYDAAYLTLAIDTGLPLASLDASLVEASHRAGVRVLGDA